MVDSPSQASAPGEEATPPGHSATGDTGSSHPTAGATGAPPAQPSSADTPELDPKTADDASSDEGEEGEEYEAAQDPQDLDHQRQDAEAAAQETAEADAAERELEVELRDEVTREDPVGLAYEDELILHVGQVLTLRMRGILQLRYQVNRRKTVPEANDPTSSSPHHVHQSFLVPRARWDWLLDVSDFARSMIRVGAVSGGKVQMQNAWGEVFRHGFTLRGGLLFLPFMWEGELLPTRVHAADYGILDSTFGLGAANGLMLGWSDDETNIRATASSGARSGFAEFRSSFAADYAVTARADHAWGTDGLAPFYSLHARPGSSRGVRVGAAGHWQSGGHTGRTAPIKLAAMTADAGFEMSRFSLLVAGAANHVKDPGGDAWDAGANAQAGVFVAADTEVFAHWSIVVPQQGDRSASSFPDASSAFNSIGAGVGQFLWPGHDQIRAVVGGEFFPNSQVSSAVAESDLSGILRTEGSQWTLRLQLDVTL